MKVRVLREPTKKFNIETGNYDIESFLFIPQYYSEVSGEWCGCYTGSKLVVMTYYDIDECIDMCKKFAETRSQATVVCENEL